MLPASDGSLYISPVSGIFRSAPAQQGRVFGHFYGSGVPENFPEVDGKLWCTDLHGYVKQVSAGGELLWQDPLGLKVLKPAPTGGVIWGLGTNENGAVLAGIDTRDGNRVDVTELGVDRTRALHVDAGGTIYISLPAQDRWDTVSDRSFPSIEAIHMRSEHELFLFCTYDPLIGRTTDGGETLTIASYEVSPAGCPCICEDSSSRLYLCCNLATPDHLQYWINLYCSDDDGASWSAADTVYTGAEFPRWPKLLIDETRRLLWVTTRLGLYRRSLDGGSGQRVCGFGYSESPFLDAGGTFYVVGEGSEGWGLYFLESEGAHWGDRRVPDGNCYDTSLVVDRDGDLWLGSSTGVHYSGDGGSSWATYAKADGLASTSVYSLAVEGSGDCRVLWVGTAPGASRGVILEP